MKSMGEKFNKNGNGFLKRFSATIENAIFNNRRSVIVLCALLTAFFGFQLQNLKLNVSYESMLPYSHPYIANFSENRGEVSGGGNAIRVVVAAKDGTVLDPEFLETLKNVSDDIYVLLGIDRSKIKSLWTPATRWLAVTEFGLEGGPVIPGNYDGSESSIQQVEENIKRSGEVGELVSRDFTSAMIIAPLLSTNTETGDPLDYNDLAKELETIREKYSSESISIHITGFAKIVGDLIEGLQKIIVFFVVAVCFACIALYLFTHSLRKTLLIVFCSLVAVVWQLGALPLLGMDLNPYSILVPFLVFAIGLSHGAQKMNGIISDVSGGYLPIDAVRVTFRRLFLAGLTALVSDAAGFAVLSVIDVESIEQLAIVASIGVAFLIVTNLILMPVLVSYFGVSERAVKRNLKGAEPASLKTYWAIFGRFTQPRWAAGAVVGGALLAIGGLTVSQDLKIGDLGSGAPELKANSRYNQDAAFINAKFDASSDVFVVIGKTKDSQCASYEMQEQIDRLEWMLSQDEAVESTRSLASLSREVFVFMNEGNPAWYELLPNQSMLNSVTNQVPPVLFNSACNTLSLLIYLKDHKAETLERIVQKVERFQDNFESTNGSKILLAAGNAGVEAATNIVVDNSNRKMLAYVYITVILLCLVTFRSWKAVLCAVLPLTLISILCEALMVFLDIGVKVSTLPVIALGVGIGVDYSLYIMSEVMSSLRKGKNTIEAYHDALMSTGRVVMLTGLTLSLGVATWILSPIKFQADMGVLLSFMFLGNMLAALILIPSLSCFLFSNERRREKSAD